MRFLVFLLVSLLVSPLAQAAEFQLDTHLIGQFRENTNAQQESPFNEYLGIGLRDFGAWHFETKTDMRYVRDFARSIDDYDLYQALLQFRPVERLQIAFGRQFLTQGFSAEVVDGLQVTLTPPIPLAVTIYSGIPRSVERGDFNRNDGLLTGLSLRAHEIPALEGGLHAAWRKTDINQTNLAENDEIRLGADLSRRWETAVSPTLYGLFEYETTSKKVETGTVGMALAPATIVSLNLEGNYFDVNRQSSRPTVIGLFTREALWSGRFSSNWTLIPRWLDLAQGYSYQRVTIQEGVPRNGHLLEVGLPLSLDPIGLFLQPGYYFSNSFGGTVHGGRVSLHEEVTDRLFVDAGVDFATYKKITQDNDTALSTFLWSGYEIVKGLRLAAGFEANQNNLFEQDIRGSLRIDYHYGKTL